MTKACELLHKLSYLDDLYSLGQTEYWALEKLKENIPLLCDWAKRFVAPSPHPDFGTMDFKTSDNPHDSEQPSVCVSALKDIEENIWSPRFGLKGMQIDRPLLYGKKQSLTKLDVHSIPLVVKKLNQPKMLRGF